MKPITPRRGRDSRRSRDARIGFSLVEVLVAMTVMVVAVVGAIGTLSSTALVGESAPDAMRAQLAAQQVLERLRATPFEDVFAEFNATPEDDPGGAGRGAGSGFAVPGLDPLADDPDGLVGEILFPSPALHPEILRETRTDRDFGMPMDLDGDGILARDDVAGSYVQLPVRVRIAWRGPSGEQELEYGTVLGGW